MVNRPRRPKAGNGPSETGSGPLDPGADTTAPGEGATPAESGLDAERISAPGEEANVGGSGAAADTPAATPRSLPPLDEQPGAPAEAIRQQRSGEDARKEGADEAEAGLPEDRNAADPSATELFAAEEGLSAKTHEPARRHLGEFEDDETLAASEPHEARHAPVTDAYRNGHDGPGASEAAAGRASTGSQIGAGLAGAVIALLGGAALVYSGLLPLGQQVSTPGQYAAAGDLESLSSEVATLRETVGQLQSAEAAGGSGTNFASVSDLAALGDRLTAAEQALQDRPAGVDSGALDALEAGATSAQDTAGAAQGAADEARTLAQDAQTQASEAQSAADEAQTLATQTGARLDDLQTRLDELANAQTQARVALAAASLKSAIDRGGSFLPELEGFEAAGGGAEAVEPLRDFAADGVPTQIELASEWTSVEADIRRALIQPDADAGVGNQLLAGLSSLVTVRSTAEDAAADADGSEAALGRMRDAMAEGDLDGWLETRQTLEPAAQEASQSFAARVEARREALSIVDTALTQATGPTPAQEG